MKWIVFSFFISILVSCGNNVSSNDSTTESKIEKSADFQINIVDMRFNYISGLDHVSFGGNISFKNESGYDISNLLFSHRYFEIDYSDNTSERFHLRHRPHQIATIERERKMDE